MILTEMIHDARIVRMNAQHLSKNIRRWMGDSVGHWEGDTLVIDTTNFTDKTRFRGSTGNLHVVERLKRIDDKTQLGVHTRACRVGTLQKPYEVELCSLWNNQLKAKLLRATSADTSGNRKAKRTGSLLPFCFLFA
jgi:hypothetical protein